MNKTVKIISAILVAVMIIMIGSTSVMAINPGDIINKMDSTEIDSEKAGNLTTVGGRIISIITTVGIVISVIVLLILGIKYMMGSASEKAEYKKTMIPYLVGAVLIFGASAIAKAVISLAEGVTTV